MRHLKDELRARSAADQRLLELVQSAESFRSNPFRKRLVLLRIQRSDGGQRSHFVLRTALAVGLVFGGTATALGALGYSYGLFRNEPAHEDTKGTPGPSPKVTKTVKVKPAARPAERQIEATEASPAAAEEAPEARPSTTRAPLASRARQDPTPRRPSRGEDPSQVLEAIRALRKERDATRAQGLLDDYLAKQPSGALTEDALALAIEAAAARHDPRAAEYARRYLQRFPNGRFRAVAERAAGRH